MSKSFVMDENKKIIPLSTTTDYVSMNDKPLSETIDSLTKSSFDMTNEFTNIANSYSSDKNDIDSISPSYGNRILLTDNKGVLTSDYGLTYDKIFEMLFYNDVSQLKQGDMIRIIDKLDNESFVQANINTYLDYSINKIKYHIDFIGRDCIASTYGCQMGGDSNNGTVNEGAPWLSSSLYTYLNTTIYDALSDKLKAHIVDKVIYSPSRYDDSSTITEDNGNSWISMGKLWVPFEAEVIGAASFSTNGYGTIGMKQYPVFKYWPQTYTKHVGPYGQRSNWWTASPSNGSSTNYAYMNNTGVIGSCNKDSETLCVPLCFRFQ